MTQPYELGVVEAVAAIRAGSLSPLELVESALDRIAATDGHLRAWVHVDHEGARAQARALTERRDYAGLLPGIPLGVKDIFDVRGQPTSASFAPWRENTAAEDATTVSNLRSQGAIPLGKTVTVQFAFGNAEDTRNPWDLDRSPSGSSSGSGAAVAARQAPAALGTQTTGSNLRPAAYNGIVGFKPTHGLLSRHGIVPLSWSMDHAGVLARSVEDAALVLDGMAHPKVGTGGQSNTFRRAARASRAPRLGLIADFQVVACPEVRENVAAVAQRLEAAGAEVGEVRLATDLDTIKAIQWTVLLSEASEVHRDQLARLREYYGPQTRDRLDVALTLPAWSYVRAQRLRRRFRLEVNQLFEEVDCLLSATAPDLPPHISENTTGDWSLLAPWSLLGLPAASVPAGRARDGMPHAIQIVGPKWRDAEVLRAAAWCEGVLGRLGAPPLDALIRAARERSTADSGAG